MKAKAKHFGEGNKGGMKQLPKGKMGKGALKKGSIASAKQPMDASDNEAEEHDEMAATPGLPQQGAGTMIHKMPANLMKDQDGKHEASGFVSGKSY